MATATRKMPPTSPTPPSRPDGRPAPTLGARLNGAARAIYRFFASLKLAVFSLGTLAGTLAFATFFESWYGTAAVNEYIYRGPWFAVLLAFLGTNILCAALIRFPWKKRQTGFVITHAGLLVLLAGSYYSVRTADEGQVGMLEGDVRDELVRTDYPVIRVREVDPHGQRELASFDLPFRPGAFSWGPGNPRPAGVVSRVINLVTFGLAGSWGSSQEELTQSGSPFRLVVKRYLAASEKAREHIADPNGTPMARMRLRFKGPGMPREQDALPDEDSQWFVTDRKFYRAVREPMRGAPALITFSVVDRPELVDDFLGCPAVPGTQGVARFRYNDRSGKARVFDLAIAENRGKSVALPESDLTVSLADVMEFPTQERGLNAQLGDDPVPIAVFKIQKAGGEPVTHMALANLPMVPNLIPPQEESEGRAKPPAQPPAPLATIHYMVAPTIDPKINRRFGEIDVLAGPGESLHYRVYGRGKTGSGELRSTGALTTGKPIVAFGGNAGMPMTISFEVDAYLPSAVEKDVCVPTYVPHGEADQQVAACLVEMTVGSETREVWLRRNEVDSLKPPRPTYLVFGDGVYSLAFDVDRKPLGFEVKLDDFDVGFEPGTPQPTRFESKVRLTDAERGIQDQPHRIWMNHPMDYRGYTFYQMRYHADVDPDTFQTTGRFQSIFQVATNPGRPIIYAGCLLVVLGTFVQFYMRAGVFTDGGKRERERAAARESAKPRQVEGTSSPAGSAAEPAPKEETL